MSIKMIWVDRDISYITYVKLCDGETVVNDVYKYKSQVTLAATMSKNVNNNREWAYDQIKQYESMLYG